MPSKSSTSTFTYKDIIETEKRIRYQANQDLLDILEILEMMNTRPHSQAATMIASMREAVKARDIKQ